ncbi:pseudouridine synthase [Cellulomonas dongxiuzhuiae]|uniref:RNA pseudouridylate synthase n=1 Tax=Cellulomonas dongxiuzhuiae TaxID=2819979 RepID=A0ABX8GJE3_9CELL|nr:pseudouridine synthase [Cellulomonas dongxiuzhuiae]MBO3095009.1 pseudouridylate synthase [Cellulomonas dongxiuzhuiae]QWC16025.1 pseudouridylate synthase [Cellulomonas dongxiuzhuiae]
MPPVSPLPARHGLGAAHLCTPSRTRGVADAWPTMGAWLRHRLPEHVDVAGMLADGSFVDEDGRALRDDDPYVPARHVWFHRIVRDEPVVPGTIHVVHRDERLVVVDKPPFLSTIPRGRHIVQSVVVRLRDELDLPELSPLHRLDRGTSGILLLATERRWRGAYQTAFERRTMDKTYRALAPLRADLELPTVVRNHLRKVRGTLHAEVVPDAPVNAETLVELEREVDGLGVYRLTPRTGRTHQLRLHLSDLGIPIVGDPLYPVLRDVDLDDFREPMQLLAAGIAFTDPVDGRRREFRSVRSLPLTSAMPPAARVPAAVGERSAATT